MLVAPLRFKSVLLEEMDRQIALAIQGKPASIILKNNSINDPQIIDKISEASCAGVRVDMIVRGICCVRAGVPGRTEKCISAVWWGGILSIPASTASAAVRRCASTLRPATFLTRNTERRVEVGVRVDDPAIAKLRGILTCSCAIPSMPGNAAGRHLYQGTPPRAAPRWTARWRCLAISGRL